MSAFMMDSKTTAMLAEQIINLIEWDFVTPRLPEKTYISAYDKDVIRKTCRKQNNQKEVPRINPICSEILFEAMELMNAQALSEKYEGRHDGELRTYPSTVREPANMPALYKSLKCYLYQCCEGKVPETDLYKTLRNIETIWADYIVSDLPEFQAAIWG